MSEDRLFCTGCGRRMPGLHEPKCAAAKNGAELKVELTAEQALVLFYLDQAIAQLSLQRNQLAGWPGMPPEASNVFEAGVVFFTKAKQQVLANLNRRVVLAAAGDVPPFPGS